MDLFPFLFSFFLLDGRRNFSEVGLGSSKRPRTGRVAEERTSSMGRPRSPPARGAPGEASWLGPSPVQTEGPPPPAPRVKIQPRPEGEEPSRTPLHPAPAAHLRRLVVFLFLLLKKQQHLGTEGTCQCPGPDGIRGHKAFGGLEGPARGRVAPAHGLGRVQSAAMATASDAHRGGTGPGTQ